MSRPPVVSGRTMIVVLTGIGYRIVRQRGSHVRLRHPSDPGRRPITVPDHRTLKAGTMRAILRDANLTVEQFTSLVRGR